MPKPSALQWRNGRAYYRRRVPTDLIKTLGKKEITKALGTSEKTKAKALKAIEDAKAEELFLKLREQAVGNDQPSDGLSRMTDNQLAELAYRWLEETERRSFDRKAKSTEVLTRQEWEDMFISLQIELQEIRDAIKFQDIGPGLTEGAKFLDRQGISFDGKSEAYRKFGFMMNDSILTYVKDAIREANGLKAPPPRLGSVHSSALAKTGQPTITIEELFTRYLDDPTKRLNAKSYANYKFTLRVLAEVLGKERLASSLTRDDCIAVMKFLKELPTNATKKFPGLTLKEAVEAGKKQGVPTQSAVSINKYMGQLSSVLKYARRFRYIDDNPAEGLQVPDLQNAKEKRAAFAIEELRAIFAAPLYRGCQNDEGGFSKPGPSVIRRARFWCPLVSLFTGMRLNEICQLEVGDIQIQDGVPVILVSVQGEAGPKKLKTAQSARVIPVHPELERVGFLAYAGDRGFQPLRDGLSTTSGRYQWRCFLDLRSGRQLNKIAQANKLRRSRTVETPRHQGMTLGAVFIELKGERRERIC